jgi:hypothetical protein
MDSLDELESVMFRVRVLLPAASTKTSATRARRTKRRRCSISSLWVE